MFQAGFARVDITPPLGSPLAGNSRYRPADRILDPLELNCVAFSDGENKAVLISADLLYVMENVATELRARIAKCCEIPADHVFLQGLHQHTSVRIGTRPHVGNIGLNDPTYLDVLYRKYCDVASLALRDLKDATLYKGEKETEKQIAFIRRFRMKDGSVMTNPGRCNPDVVGPIGKPDNTVRVLRFAREEADDIVMINFSTHPDTVGGCRISADWPGKARRFTENALEGTKCMVVNGAEGDSNHVDVNDPDQIKGYQVSTDMGNEIMNTVLAVWDQMEPVETGRIWGKVEMRFIPTNTKGLEETVKYQRLRTEIARGEREKPRDIAELGEIYRIAELQKELLFQKVPVCVLCLGKVGFVGFGGEPFMQYAEAAREAGKEIYIITACLADGGQGYLPTKEAFDEGGYEARTSRFTPVVAEDLQGTAARLLEEYRNL